MALAGGFCWPEVVPDTGKEMLCAPTTNVERDELVLDRSVVPPSDSFLKAPQLDGSAKGEEKSDGQLDLPGSKSFNVYTASERHLVGLIIQERQERRKDIAHEQEERVKQFEELWKKMEQEQVQQMFAEGGGHRHTRHAGTWGSTGKKWHSHVDNHFTQYSNRLMDVAIAQGAALGELMEAMLHNLDNMYKKMPSYSLIQSDVQALKDRVVAIRDNWHKEHDPATTELYAEVRPEELGPRIVALEAFLQENKDLKDLEKKTDDKVQELMCQVAAMEEEMQGLQDKAAEMAQKVVDKAAASGKLQLAATAATPRDTGSANATSATADDNASPEAQPATSATAGDKGDSNTSNLAGDGAQPAPSAAATLQTWKSLGSGGQPAISRDSSNLEGTAGTASESTDIFKGRSKVTTGTVLEDLRKKVRAVEDKQETQGKDLKEALTLRADVVKLMMSAPIQAVRAHRTALRCVELPPEKRLEMLKALDAKEEELKADMAKVKERHTALGLGHLPGVHDDLDKDVAVPQQKHSRGRPVPPLTSLE